MKRPLMPDMILVVVFDNRLEHIFAYAAQRAAPVSGKIFKGCAGLDAVLRIAFLGIICIAAGIAKIFFHSRYSPYLFVYLYAVFVV